MVLNYNIELYIGVATQWNFLRCCNTIRVSTPCFSDLLQYHYVRGTYYSAGLRDGETLPTVQGTDVVIHKNNGKRPLC